MKKILVAGARSFVGRSFARWLERFGGRYRTDFVSLRAFGRSNSPQARRCSLT